MRFFHIISYIFRDFYPFRIAKTLKIQKMALHSAAKGKLISVIGDEDTCVGFLLGGVGEINKNRHPNFMVVDKSNEEILIWKLLAIYGVFFWMF